MNRCCKQVHDGPGYVGFHQCFHEAKVERDGKWYCGVHDPQRHADKPTITVYKVEGAYRLELLVAEMVETEKTYTSPEGKTRWNKSDSSVFASLPKAKEYAEQVYANRVASMARAQDQLNEELKKIRAMEEQPK